MLVHSPWAISTRKRKTTNKRSDIEFESSVLKLY